jgi:hypothetical protein
VRSGELDSSSHLSGVGLVMLSSSRPVSPAETAVFSAHDAYGTAAVGSRPASRAGTADSGSSPDQPEQKEILSPAVLPIFLQLRPSVPNRSPMYHFRLFFIDGEWIAASPVSAFTYYGEHMKNRDLLLNALYSYANSTSVKQMVHGYYARFHKYAVLFSSF